MLETASVELHSSPAHKWWTRVEVADRYKRTSLLHCIIIINCQTHKLTIIQYYYLLSNALSLLHCSIIIYCKTHYHTILQYHYLLSNALAYYTTVLLYTVKRTSLLHYSIIIYCQTH